MQIGRPMIPPMTPEVERMFWREHTRTRVINRGTKIYFDGLTYSSPELRNVEHTAKDGTSVPYSIRYQKSNLSRIALFRDGHWICDVFANNYMLQDDSFLSVSSTEKALENDIKKLAAKLGHGLEDSSWENYIHDIDARNVQRRQEKETAGSTKPASNKSIVQDVNRTLSKLYPDELERARTHPKQNNKRRNHEPTR